MDSLAKVEKKIERKKIALQKADRACRSLARKYHVHIFHDALRQAGWQSDKEWREEDFFLLVGFLRALKCSAIPETDRRLYLHLAKSNAVKTEGDCI